MAMMAESAPAFTEQTFSDFHLYTLSHNVTITENSKKQLELFDKVENVPIRKYNAARITFSGSSERELKFSNKIDISNSAETGLGLPLPKGVVRAFQPDPSDGSLEFLGEDSIGHTPVEEEFTLTTGNAFDLTGDKVVSNFVEFPRVNNRYAGYQADVALTLNNRKIYPVEAEIIINDYRGDNLIITWPNTQELTKVSAREYKVIVMLPASTSVVLDWHEEYRV